MGNLYGSYGPLFFHEADDGCQSFGLGVVPDTQIARRNATLGTYSAGFGHDQSGATHRAAAEVNHVPVTGYPVRGGVLTHGGDDNAVAQRYAAQGPGCEQFVTHACPPRC